LQDVTSILKTKLSCSLTTVNVGNIHVSFICAVI